VVNRDFDTLDNAPTIPGEPGEQILSGRYKIVREVGSGGMGTVYLARDLELDMDVAIKVLPAILARNKRAIENLRCEAKTALKLTHTNIVRLYHFQSEEEIKYIVMEYVDGGSLEEKISESGTLSFDQTLKIFTQVASGLDYAHSQNVLHRDIKPANIMLAKDGMAKLADFGIARQLKDSMTHITGKVTSGTLLYMAPEQFRGGEPDHRSDIYSLAASIYESLSGKPPFWRGSIEYQVINVEPAPLGQLNDKQNRALLKALSKKPSDRQNNAKELLADLGADSATLNWQPTKRHQEKSSRDTLDYSKTITGTEKQRRKGTKVKIIAAIIVMALLLAGVFVVRDYQNREQQRTDAIKKQEDLLKAQSRQNDAEKAAEKGDYPQAIELLDKLIAEYPDTQYAQWALAKKLVWQKTLEEQRQMRSRVAALLSKAETQKTEGSLDKSLEAVGEVLKLDSTNEQAKKLQADLSSLIEKRKSEEEKEKSFKTYFDAGYAYESKDNWEKAIEAYTKALAAKPDDSEVKDKLATCQHNLYLVKAEEAKKADNLDSAIDNYTKALSSKQIASTQMKLDTTKKTLQDRLEAEGKKREYDKWITQAQSAEKDGNLPAAIKFYQKAQEYTNESLKEKIDTLNKQIANAEKQKKPTNESVDSQQVSGGTKPASVLLREGLYAEEVEANIDAAMKIYGQIVDDKSASRDIVAQALYRQGMCYLKKKDDSGARAVFETLTAEYTDQTEIIEKVKPLLGKINSTAQKHGKEITNSIGMKLVYIPSGEFLMGSPESQYAAKLCDDEIPQHKVKVSKSFYMGIYEVTQFQYQMVMATNPSYFIGENNPVEQVSWNDAVKFCRMLSRKEGKTYRLPTEAEWEYACRAGSGSRFSCGDNYSDLDAYAWYSIYSVKQDKTCPVGQKKPNAFGLYDMHGNVWEWCSDWYGETYYRDCPDIDPQGPSSGNARVIRGGSCCDSPWYWRSAARHRSAPDSSGPSIGFRVVMEEESESSGQKSAIIEKTEEHEQTVSSEETAQITQTDIIVTRPVAFAFSKLIGEGIEVTQAFMRRDKAGFLELYVSGFNHSQFAKKFQYKVEWINKDDRVLRSETNVWFPMSVMGQSPFNFKFLAPYTEAVNFRMEVRKLK
jgi:formylglycine-generating enzyme required for sulfatase activity/serine/threonine protein kinase